jgi:hypothetical protein
VKRASPHERAPLAARRAAGLAALRLPGRVLVAGILPDIAWDGWHWKIMDVLKPPRRERWTLRGKATTEEEARVAAERKWRQLCEAYGLAPQGIERGNQPT